MLTNENTTPEKLGYDKPSEKLLKFLKRHYDLDNYVPQNNNFVIFDTYFKKKVVYL